MNKIANPIIYAVDSPQRAELQPTISETYLHSKYVSMLALCREMDNLVLLIRLTVIRNS